MVTGFAFSGGSDKAAFDRLVGAEAVVAGEATVTGGVFDSGDAAGVATGVTSGEGVGTGVADAVAGTCLELLDWTGCVD